MLTALALFTAVTSSLYYLSPSLRPQVPRYTLTTVRFSALSMSYFPFNDIGSLSATFLAGVKIENENPIGADIYATIVDLYYPDWSGDLQHIGILKETERWFDNTTMKGAHTYSGEGDAMKHTNGTCIVSSSPPVPQPSSSPLTPFFTVAARSTSLSTTDAVSIILTKVAPSTYLRLFLDALASWGAVEIRVSGGAHVRSSLNLPLTLGLTCNNDLYLFRYPARIEGKDCVVRGVRPGWLGLEDYVKELRVDAMRQYEEDKVFLMRQGK